MITFDRSYLPACSLEFVVVADTHHIVDPGMYSAEGDSVTPELTRDWSYRGDVALAYVKALGPLPVFHVGDLQQEYPGHPTFDAGRRAAIDQLARAEVAMHHVAGNMDVGDKPDPTMPAGWVRREYLDVWNEDFGPSYYATDSGGFHFVILNSQVMNTSLIEQVAQREWLEVDLRAHAGDRIVIFLHIPPFLVDEREPGLGSYDVIDEPDRSWLLSLIRQYHVEAVFCGHTHFQVINRVGTTRIYTAPSTTTTRPGFYEAFSVAPPSRGWADTPKLGLFLVRAMHDGLAVHLIRTGGRATLNGSTGETVITRVSRELPHSPLGTYLRLPLARHSDGAIAYPYQVRHRIRDDYPLLACLELGLRHVRFPIHDLDIPMQRDQLALLRTEGVALTATVIWGPGAEHPEISRRLADVDILEIQMAGGIMPNEDEFRAIVAASSTAKVALAPIVMEATRTVHRRSRTGYRPGELVQLDKELTNRGMRLDRAVCFVDAMSSSAWHSILEFKQLDLRAIEALDFVLPLGSGESIDLAMIAKGILATATVPGSRLVIDPLQELDRTAVVMNGLIDRLSNPTPAFDVVRVLNTVLFSVDTPPPAYQAECLVELGDVIAEGVSNSEVEHWLLSPDRAAGVAASLERRVGRDSPLKLVDLVKGESREPILVGELPQELNRWQDGLALITLTGSRVGTGRGDGTKQLVDQGMSSEPMTAMARRDSRRTNSRLLCH